MMRAEAERSAGARAHEAGGRGASEPGAPAAPIYLEFVGLPGSGKSTVRRIVGPNLRARGIRAGTGIPGQAKAVEASGKGPGAERARTPSGRRFLRSVRYHLGMGPLVLSAYGYLFRHGTVTKNRIRMVRSLLHTLEKIQEGYDAARERGAQVVIRDQGGVAYLRQLMADAHPASDEQWRRVIEAAREQLPPARRLAVVFDLPSEIAVERIQSRPGSLGRWDRLHPERALAELAAQRPRIDALMESLVGVGAFHEVLRVDARRSPEELGDEITQFILERLPRSTG